ncbi:MAG TPA: hypothetical protein VFT85_08330 [Acidimicrobiia bacterium]|nr:hypothetical protein [Acidimicrobiia bacterium]
MRTRWIAILAVFALVVVACDGDDAELSTDSTILTGPSATDPASEATTTTAVGGSDGTSPPTTLTGEVVASYEVVAEFENDNGVEQHIVIPEGAYTDVDLENFVFDLIEQNPDLYGAEIFDDASAAEAFVVPEAERTEEQTASLERHHFVTLTGRDRIDYRGPFAEFPGGAIGS